MAHYIPVPAWGELQEGHWKGLHLFTGKILTWGLAESV